jgi:hypothetical protein
MTRLIDLTGQRFGLWHVVCRGKTEASTCGTRVFWSCVCDCGSSRDVLGHYLRSGESRSCGCMSNQFKAEHWPESLKRLHPSEYSIWMGMRTRCSNPRRNRARRYIELGITVCERWDSFSAFLSDMGPRPSPTHSIDRIDGTKGYSPENCRWATPLEQRMNTTRVRVLTIAGETKPVVEWAASFGISPKTVKARIDKYGWEPIRALSTPARTWGR